MPDTGSLAGVKDAEQARYHWVMNCQGCHGVNAQGIGSGVPRIEGSIARFLSLEAGRAYLARVPGVAFVGLSDAEVAQLLNWVVQTFDAANLRAPFKPYTTAEIARWRRDPLISDAYVERNKLLQALK